MERIKNNYMMHNIRHEKPEPIVEGSTSRFFLILFRTEEKTYSAINNGFVNFEEGAIPVRREDAIKQFYYALRNAREWSNGELKLVPLPNFE